MIPGGLDQIPSVEFKLRWQTYAQSGKFWSFLSFQAKFGSKYLKDEMSNALTKRFSDLWYLLSMIPDGLDQIPSVEFKLKWQTYAQNRSSVIFLVIFRLSLEVSISKTREQCFNYKKGFLIFDTCFHDSRWAWSNSFGRLQGKAINMLAFLRKTGVRFSA